MEKKLRIKKPSDFKKTFREGKRFSSPHFVLYIRKNTLPEARLGVSISKGQFKLATRRNRLRRIAKETFRKEISPYIQGYDCVLATKRGGATPHLKQAIEELKQLILKIKP